MSGLVAVDVDNCFIRLLDSKDEVQCLKNTNIMNIRWGGLYSAWLIMWFYNSGSCGSGGKWSSSILEGMVWIICSLYYWNWDLTFKIAICCKMKHHRRGLSPLHSLSYESTWKHHKSSKRKYHHHSHSHSCSANPHIRRYHGQSITRKLYHSDSIKVLSPSPKITIRITTCPISCC